MIYLKEILIGLVMSLLGAAGLYLALYVELNFDYWHSGIDALLIMGLSAVLLFVGGYLFVTSLIDEFI